MFDRDNQQHILEIKEEAPSIEAPDEYNGPTTLEAMQCPVLASDAHHYDLLEWINIFSHGGRSPIDRTDLEKVAIVDAVLRLKIQKFYRKLLEKNRSSLPNDKLALVQQYADGNFGANIQAETKSLPEGFRVFGQDQVGTDIPEEKTITVNLTNNYSVEGPAEILQFIDPKKFLFPVMATDGKIYNVDDLMNRLSMSTSEDKKPLEKLMIYNLWFHKQIQNFFKEKLSSDRHLLEASSHSEALQLMQRYADEKVGDEIKEIKKSCDEKQISFYGWRTLSVFSQEYKEEQQGLAQRLGRLHLPGTFIRYMMMYSGCLLTKRLSNDKTALDGLTNPETDSGDKLIRVLVGSLIMSSLAYWLHLRDLSQDNQRPRRTIPSHIMHGLQYTLAFFIGVYSELALIDLLPALSLVGVFALPITLYGAEKTAKNIYSWFHHPRPRRPEVQELDADAQANHEYVRLN